MAGITLINILVSTNVGIANTLYDIDDDAQTVKYSATSITSRKVIKIPKQAFLITDNRCLNISRYPAFFDRLSRYTLP